MPRELDVADEAATRALVEEVERQLGPIDIWFANAGLATGGGPEAPDATGTVSGGQRDVPRLRRARAAARMVERGEGHLVTTASMAGILTALGDAAYAATKHAAVGFAEWLAFTYAGQGVKRVVHLPGRRRHGDAPGRRRRRRRKGQRGDRRGRGAGARAGRGTDPRGRRRGPFLILTHPEMHEFVVGKAQDPERWIRGMSKLGPGPSAARV